MASKLLLHDKISDYSYDVELERELIEKAKQVNEFGAIIYPEAVQGLIDIHAPFIRHLANKYSNRTVFLQSDDFFNEGVLGLIKGIRKYDFNNPSKAKLITYACHWIRHKMRRAYTSYEYTIRVPEYNRASVKHNIVNLGKPIFISDNDKITVESFIPAKVEQIVYYDDDKIEDIAHPFELIKFTDLDFTVLTDKEIYIIKECVMGDRSMADIATEFDLTRERIRQIKVMALAKLKNSVMIINQEL